MFCELIVVGIALLVYAFYRLSSQHAQYFEERSLKHRGILFTLDNLYSAFFGKFDVFGMMESLYHTFPEESIFGVFDFSVRQYFVRDPEVYKQIAIKDFDHFLDHREFINSNVDRFFGNSLIALHGEKWRQMRATLSPAFTGSKMRQMFELVSECTDDLVKHFSNLAERGEKIHIEMKDFFSRYTNDVIATCAFGVKVNSFIDPKNEFYMNGKQLLDFSGLGPAFRMFITMLIPKLAQTLSLSFFDGPITESFKNMILDTMAVRKSKNIVRPDLINMLMQIREGTLKHKIDEEIKESMDGFATAVESEVGTASVTRKWSDEELVAQCFIFFLAGFETSSSVLSFTAYELVANPDVQQKLYEEIAEMNEHLNGNRISYDGLQKMKYLDQVVSEALRKYPITVQTDRTCVKDYVYDDGDKLRFKIEKGSNIQFSMYSLHRDPKYYPNPNKFDPERFNDENKHKIMPGTYLPFGIGPRNCIGSRFALMEIKCILYNLLLNFSFEVNKDTQIPLKMKRVAFMMTEKGIHLELRPREYSTQKKVV